MKKCISILLFLIVIFPFQSGTVWSKESKGNIYIPLDSQTDFDKTADIKIKNTFKDLSASTVAFTSDGNIVATAGRGNTIYLYEAETGKTLKKLEGRLKAVYSLNFSPDRRLLASGDHLSMVNIWDVSTGKIIKDLKGHSSVVYAVAFRPDGKMLSSGSRDRTIKLWDVSSGKVLHTLKGHTSVVYSVAFSPDGNILASGSHDRSIILWDVSKAKILKTLKGHTSAVHSVAFSPDGRILASGSHDRNIILWDVTTGKIINTLKKHRSVVNSVTFSPDGRILASGSHDKSVVLWSMDEGKSFKTLKQHRSVVYSVAFSPGGNILASASKDRTVILWNVAGSTATNIAEISQFFKKDEFETTEEFNNRVTKTAFHYATKVSLKKYNADKEVFAATVSDTKVFIRVPRNKAREMKKRAKQLYIEGGLLYYKSTMAELVNAFLVDNATGKKFPFGKHIKGLKITSLGESSHAKAVVRGAPKLSFEASMADSNKNGILEGGETVAMKVKVSNTGKGSARGVRVILTVSGEETLLNVIGKERILGIIPPGGVETVEFGGILPNEFTPGNVDVKVVVKESRGYSPTEVKKFTFAMKPAAIKETTTVLSRMADVDIIPKKPRGHICKDCYALVIGISKYRSVPEVKYAAKDADIVARYLETVGGIPLANMKILKNASATKADIESSVEEWLPRRVKTSSNVFVYYAGHGTPDPKTSEAFIVPYEGEPGYFKKLYPLKKFYRSLDKLPSENVFVMLDSCFSGSGGRSIIPEGSRPVTLSIENPLLAGSKLIVLAASKGSEISSDYDKVRHGLFTYFLLRGLKGDADQNEDGNVDVKELYHYVSDNVSETAVRELDREQNPVLLPGPEKIKGKKLSVSRVK